MSWLSSATGPMTTHFWGPVANWGLSLSAMYDASVLGPEVINERMSATQCCYSALFMRFAWCVQPRNYILLGCHTANVAAQANQLRRWAGHKLETEPATAPAKLQNLGMMGGAGAAGLAAILLARKPLQASLANIGPIKGLVEHPAGPFYIHFWAPNFKWALSINNLMDYDRPTDKISLSMMSALTLTGCIFCRWSFVITPVNYSLFFVNCVLSLSSGYHLGRKVKADYM
eukprot:TRINITY_DN277_c0_g2_i1.p1 TRINITY_DN277_c0_g2~~TRINITY_DN277_c0_g2_i1.p1  ORF type:complete len:230 (-),score=49.65 TRINITY_DN277_c0_g2_i1:309-998(-)